LHDLSELSVDFYECRLVDRVQKHCHNDSSSGISRFVLQFTACIQHFECRQEVSIMSKSHLFRTIVTLVSALSLFTALQADPPENKGKSGKAKNELNADKSGINVDLGLSAMVTAGISFGDARRLATRYDLTGSKPLPPGIRKNLARGKPMPPGIQKTRMPDSFISQLPRHEGYEWQQAGSDLVLVVIGSLVISDVLEGVFD
jgi:hypothetical protein